MFASLRARLLISYLVLISVTLCIVGTALLFLLLGSPLPSRQTYQRLTDIARSSAPLLKRNPDQADAILTEIAQSAEIRILRVSSTQQVLFDTDHTLPIGQVLQVQNVQVEGKNAHRGTYRDASGQVWLYIAYD